MSDINVQATPCTALTEQSTRVRFCIRLHQMWRKAVQVTRLAIGVPDYDVYLAHRRNYHPHESVMSYPEFFNERQAARYDKGSSRCC